MCLASLTGGRHFCESAFSDIPDAAGNSETGSLNHNLLLARFIVRQIVMMRIACNHKDNAVGLNYVIT